MGIELGSYDHLLDAEREVLSRGADRVSKIALIKALRDATGLSLRDAKRAVENYLARRGGRVDAESTHGWIDDLLDAERAAAVKEERPVNRILLIRALRGAAPLGLKEAKDEVDAYLRRKGGEDLPLGSVAGPVAFLVLLALAALAAVGYAISRG